jgi:peptidoglycan hydrolase-like protein with peptidoglycan-binding domain
MRRQILATAAVIALGAGLSVAGTTPADAWSQSGMHSRMTHVSRADVRDIQQKLQADNLYQGKIDGKLGRQSRRAIAEYQKQNGLRVTANLDRQTKDSLLGTTGTATPPSSPQTMAPAPRQSTAPASGTPKGGTPATGR